MPAPVAPPDAEVQRLQELVSQLQGKLDALWLRPRRALRTHSETVLPTPVSLLNRFTVLDDTS